MAELPVTAAAMNLVIAISRLANKALYMASLGEDILEMIKKVIPNKRFPLMG
jgi:septum formation topological specificity factor MinE